NLESLNNTEELLTCHSCLDSLKGFLSFTTNCVNVDENLKCDKIEDTDDKGQIELKDIPQFTFRPTPKYEIEFCDVNEVGARSDENRVSVKTEEEIVNQELIVNMEENYIKSEQSKHER
ncbi:hypothetical protein NQ314_014820, partial [Rhamnusium bicolor]